MLGARLRHLALACLCLPIAATAQDGRASQFAYLQDAGRLYEQSQSDVTLPIASGALSDGNGAEAVTVPTENLATPMRCMTAWSYLAGRAIEAPQALSDLHPDFTEATASAHWQHWLNADLEAHQGVISSDFHQRRLAAERAFSVALARQEEAYAFRTLGTCFVALEQREVGDPTQLLRNFMITHQGLPESYAVPTLQRQLRAFPISETAERAPEESCDEDAPDLQDIARTQAIIQCFERGGILASKIKLSTEDADDICRVTAAVQCENIP